MILTDRALREEIRFTEFYKVRGPVMWSMTLQEEEPPDHMFLKETKLTTTMITDRF